MQKCLLVGVLGIISFYSQADMDISLEVGISSYSFLTLGQDSHRSEVRSGALITQLKTRASDEGHINPAIGFSVDKSINSDFSMKLSAMYLGKPKLQHELTYVSGENALEQTETSTFQHHFSSISVAGSYRLVGRTYLDLGYGRFFERAKAKSEELQISDGVIRSLAVSSDSYSNDEGHLTFGITTDLNRFDRSDLQFRWQHLQSMYGPVQLFTLGLIY